MKIGLITRLKAAYNAFRMKDGEYIVAPFRRVSYVRPGECDVNWRIDDKSCKNNQTVCMSRTIISIEIKREDHWHVCDEHAKKLKGKTEDPYKLLEKLT